MHKLCLALPSQRQAGFTLVEVSIVAVVIGLLAAIAIPQFTGARDKSDAGNAKSTVTAGVAQAGKLIDGDDYEFGTPPAQIAISPQLLTNIDRVSAPGTARAGSVANSNALYMESVANSQEVVFCAASHTNSFCLRDAPRTNQRLYLVGDSSKTLQELAETPLQTTAAGAPIIGDGVTTWGTQWP